MNVYTVLGILIHFIHITSSIEITWEGETIQVNLTQSQTEDCFYRGETEHLKVSYCNCSYKTVDTNQKYVLSKNTPPNSDLLWVREKKILPRKEISGKGGVPRSRNQEKFFSLGEELRNLTVPPAWKQGCELVELEGRQLGKSWDTPGRVGVGIVTDNLRLRELGGDRGLLRTSTANIVMLVQDIMGDLPGQYKVQVSLSGVVHLETKTPLPWEVPGLSPTDVLYAFADWAQDEKLLYKYNTVVLLTGQTLQGGTIGIASLSSYCRGGVGVVESLFSDPAIAKTVAHELGHTLGIRHSTSFLPGTAFDTPDKVSACSSQVYSVMYPYIVGTSYIWDSCSVTWFKMYIEGFPYGCLSGKCTFYGGYTPECFSIQETPTTKRPTSLSPSTSPSSKITLPPTKYKPRCVWRNRRKVCKKKRRIVSP